MADELVRTNISLPKILKEEWEKFAKDRGDSFSGLVRAAIPEYIAAEQKKKGVASVDSIVSLEKMLLQKFDEKMAFMTEQMKKLAPPSEIPEKKKDALKAQITSILENIPAGVEPKKLAQFCGFPRESMITLIAELQNLGFVVIKKGLVKLA
jgi:hypothetical protein